MNFQHIPPVPLDLLDLAFRRARQVSAKEPAGRLQARISIIKDVLADRLMKIADSFPQTRELLPYYQELMRLLPDLQKHLATAVWGKKQISILARQHMKKVPGARDLNTLQKAYYGRISSVMKQVNKSLEILDKARKIMVTYPDIKNMPTVCIVGFPNVGKTTLLHKLTGAKAEVHSYPFTTKGINVGYIGHTIQVLDTPGTLNRPDTMNLIEKQAYLALKHLAHVIVYVFDVTEPYSLTRQRKLLQRIKEYEKPIILYASKADIADVSVLAYKKLITDPLELKKMLVSNTYLARARKLMRSTLQG